MPVNMNEVTHIFYHSLIVDPDRGFAGDDYLSAGFKQWMTTVDEFNNITQAMYDNGYVLVRLRDLVVQTTDADGTVHFTANPDLKLPAGKKGTQSAGLWRHGASDAGFASGKEQNRPHGCRQRDCLPVPGGDGG